MKYFILPSVALVALLIAPQAFAADSFVPLTSIPGIDQVSDADSLAGFLNTLYKLAIGVASVLAVFQIIRGGIMYMLEGSVLEKREAKHHIFTAVIGLVLVLSPALVFGIINPKILDLNIGVDQLTPGAMSPQSGSSSSAPVACSPGITNGSTISQSQAHCCAEKDLHPHATGGGNVICRPEPAETEDLGDENYFLLTPGRHYLIVHEDPATKTDGSCLQTAVGSYETAAACQATMATQEERDGWVIGTDCYLATERSPRFPKASYFCEDIQALP